MDKKIPKYDECFNQVLKVLDEENGKSLQTNQIGIKVREKFYSDYPPELLNERYTASGGNKLLNRLSFAVSFLSQGGYIERESWGNYRLSQKGAEFLKKGERLTLDELKNQPEYKERNKKSDEDESNESDAETTSADSSSGLTPKDLIDKSIKKLEKETQDELLETLLKFNPYYFESFVTNLLSKMGYGDPIFTSGSRDGGIDGIINEDKLGLRQIYIQTKRFDKKTLVTEKNIRDFSGALIVNKDKDNTEKRGVFVTTSDFNDGAKSAAKSAKILLINGEKLAKFMFDYEFGVKVTDTIAIKEIDKELLIEEGGLTAEDSQQ